MRSIPFSLIKCYYYYYYYYVFPAYFAKLTGAVEYTDCISAERQDPLNECPGYDTKQSDGEAPVMLELWAMRNTPHCHRPLGHSGPEW